MTKQRISLGYYDSCVNNNILLTSSAVFACFWTQMFHPLLPSFYEAEFLQALTSRCTEISTCMQDKNLAYDRRLSSSCKNILLCFATGVTVGTLGYQPHPTPTSWMSKYTYNKSSKFLGTFSSHQHSCKDLSYFAQNIYHHYPRSCMMLQGREINKFLGLAAKGATKSINRRRNQGRVSNVTYVYHLTYPTALLQCH